MTEECGVGQRLLICCQEANLPPEPRTFLGKKKWGLPISPKSCSVQPDVSYINVLFCLFILVGGLSSQPSPITLSSLPWPLSPGSSQGGVSESSLFSPFFLLVVTPAGCIAFKYCTKGFLNKMKCKKEQTETINTHPVTLM